MAACGPIVSGVQIINADIALSAAKTAGADQHSLYEYTAAQQYLHKAREEHGYSDFSAARVFADKALAHAVKARKISERATKAGQPASLPPQ
jgi:hypothetical protein